MSTNKAAAQKSSDGGGAGADAHPLTEGDHVYLVDGSGYIFRAYHALPPLTRSDGLPVGAVSGFCNMLWKLLQDVNDGEKPSHIAVIFDHKKKTFRSDIYPEYKANRPPPPEDLVPQFPLIREATKAFNVACIELEGFEADDLIATYAVQAVAAGADATIVSSDKDLMQLVRPGIKMMDTMKNRRIGEAEVLEKFGVTPDKVIDVQSLAGDSTDNIPGVPGIGVKTAVQLLEEYGDLDTLLARAEEIKQKKRRENLIEFADQARISRDLVTLKQDVPVEEALESFSIQRPIADQVLGFLREMEFNTITKRVAEALGADVPAPVKKKKAAAKTDDGAAKDGQKSEISDNQPADLAAHREAVLLGIPVDLKAYETVQDLDALKGWVAEATALGYFAFDTETNSLDAMSADLVGFSLATEPGRACYVPLAHKASDGLDLDGTGGVEQIALEDALEVMKPLLESSSVLKIGQNLKYDCLLLKRYGIELAPYDDTMLISYALDAGRGGHGMDALADRHLGHTCIKFKDVAGTGKSQVTFDLVALDKATEYAAEDADITLRLWMMLKPRLAAEQMMTVYETLERPLAPVLTDMEKAGIKVDRQILSRLSGTFAQRMGGLEDEIQSLAGETFNVGSPKQLGEILFEKKGYPGGKKTKTGAFQTGADVLETLAHHEELTEDQQALPRAVLEWRQMSKLKSTYTDALPEFINSETGRIHTSFAMAASSTGRLASTDPNLQNIPIRTEEGREIRTAFIAEKGKKLISADYSQIELRVLAHIADIDALKKAFEDGLDIHAMTASEMFGEAIEGMDPMVRRRAKAINFGIIYGISAFGLANQLGISRTEASDYIKTYFERFPGIKDYMEETKRIVHERGFVETIFGRRVHYPEVNTKNPNMRAFFERAAINAPIQGSAADIIRRAMIRMGDALAEANLSSVMLLQVHDELIFEAPEKQVDKTITVASKIMEGAALPAVDFSVPLKVDARAADNWDEAH